MAYIFQQRSRLSFKKQMDIPGLIVAGATARTMAQISSVMTLYIEPANPWLKMRQSSLLLHFQGIRTR